MDTHRWQQGAEEYYTIQALVYAGQRGEALQRAERALATCSLTRKQAARLYLLLCQLHTEPSYWNCPVAVLCGEEAVRLATLLRDPWIKCEALVLLVYAYAYMGDIPRATAACAAIGVEIHTNSAVLRDGYATLWSLRALVASTKGDIAGAFAALNEAEAAAQQGASTLVRRMRLQKVMALLIDGRVAEASQVAHAISPASAAPEDSLEWEIIRICLDMQTDEPGEWRHVAQRALNRAIFHGRFDLARQISHLQWLGIG